MNEIWNDCPICGSPLIQNGVLIDCSSPYENGFPHYWVDADRRKIYDEIFYIFDEMSYRVLRFSCGTQINYINLTIVLPFKKFSKNNFNKLLLLI